MFPDTVEALSEMARVMKKGSRLAVMTFVKRRLFKFRRVYEHLRKDHGAHIFDVEEIDSYLSQTGTNGGQSIIFRIKMFLSSTILSPR